MQWRSQDIRLGGVGGGGGLEAGRGGGGGSTRTSIVNGARGERRGWVRGGGGGSDAPCIMLRAPRQGHPC